ncbi:hypothetical protein NC652_017349 [Populus alba x Populus x berolinensis]|nr:hypothetical protein NC652_017349 [Populus alba x Populus x berolinensis]
MDGGGCSTGSTRGRCDGGSGEIVNCRSASNSWLTRITFLYNHCYKGWFSFFVFFPFPFLYSMWLFMHGSRYTFAALWDISPASSFGGAQGKLIRPFVQRSLIYFVFM